MSWTDVGVKVSRGARCEVCGPARCGFASNELPVGLSLSLQGGSLNGGVPTRHVVVETSPCPVVGEIPVEAVVSPVVPVAEASFNLSGPAGQWLAGRQDQSPCGRGSIVVCSNRL